MLASLIQFAILILGLVGSLGLFLSMKREVRENTLKNRQRLQEISQRLDAVHLQPAETIYLPAAPRAGLNITKRVQAVRMLRRHQDVAHIAAALGVTRKEVELLIHVHRVTQAKASTAGAQK